MKGKCIFLDYPNNICITTGRQCEGAQACEDYQEEE